MSGPTTESDIEFTTIQSTADKKDEDQPKQLGKFSPTIKATLDFGDKNESYDDEFPSSRHPMILEDIDVRLNKINYKLFEYTGGFDGKTKISYISAIQLQFTNGLVGPWFKHSNVGNSDRTESISIPPTHIKKISMAVDRNIGIAGLRMSGSSGTIVDLDFSEKSSLSSMWKSETIPDG